MDTTTRLIDRYRKWALMRGKSDVRKVNYAYGKLTQVRRQLFEAGPESAQAIMSLLDDESVHVRFAAAFDTLSIDPETALPVLRELARCSDSSIQFSAENTLEFWDAGTLELPDWKKRDRSRAHGNQRD